MTARTWTIATLALLTACATQPSQPPSQPTALDRTLASMGELEQAINLRAERPDDPQAAAIVNRVVPSLTHAYVHDASIDDPTRSRLLELLSYSRDCRAQAAWARAANDYQPGDPSVDLVTAAQAIAGCQPPEPSATDALLKAFLRFEVDGPDSQGAWPLRRALVSISAPSWEGDLIRVLQRPMHGAQAHNEASWQGTAAQILGNLRSEPAVRPLLKVMVDPSKAPVHTAAAEALLQIGARAMPAVLAAVEGRDAELLAYAHDLKRTDAAVIRAAAVVLGTMGRQDGRDALVRALDRLEPNDWVSRAMVAREIAKCPPSAEARRAVLRVLQELPPSTMVPPNMLATDAIIEQLTHWFDSTLVDELQAQGQKASGAPEDKERFRAAAASTMVRLMRASQVPQVQAAIQKWAPGDAQLGLEKLALSHSKEVLRDCQEELACYWGKLESAAAPEHKAQQVAGIKAAYMLGMLGDSQTRDQLAQRIPTLDNPVVQYAAAMALDHLAADGDAKAADALGAYVAELERGDAEATARAHALRTIVYRLRARAE